ncbi:hypothetical protein [Sphingomonas sp. IBVSS2]|uniref:hypothetical protein n=1 Tax=Sphingomonas sp. IBVSS2 TaxID=1985172 RepID=UPI001C52A17D|nr:hypothetical protein [Sphingomonas sp. IBVSS2]
MTELNRRTLMAGGIGAGIVLNGLKREELIAWNSMILHEIYFSSLGPPTRPGAALAAAIEAMSQWLPGSKAGSAYPAMPNGSASTSFS